MTFRFNELSKYGCLLDASMYFQYVFLSITSISKKMCGWILIKMWKRGSSSYKEPSFRFEHVLLKIRVLRPFCSRAQHGSY